MEERGKNTIPIRPGEGFDPVAVEQFLREHVPGLPDAPLEAEQFTAGHSNLTYLLRCGDWEGVLRRPPLGPIPPESHNMEREQRILSMIHKVFPLVPEPYVFSSDTSLIGAPFYIMERKKGILLDREWPRPYERTPELCQRISEGVIDTLVRLHSVDYQAAGLTSFGRPEGYLKRQVLGWINRFERVKTDEAPEVHATEKWLMDNLPDSPEPTIIHNDYKLNNLILSEKDLGQVVAVLDWELATLGDPLSDLASTAVLWFEEEDIELVGDEFKSVTMLPGFYSRRELLENYAAKSGRDLREIGYYLVFAYFKLAVMCQQIYFRWKKGQSRDDRHESLGKISRLFMQRAYRIALGET